MDSPLEPEKKKKGKGDSLRGDPGPEREEKRRRRRTEATTGVKECKPVQVWLDVSGVRVAEVESYHIASS